MNATAYNEWMNTLGCHGPSEPNGATQSQINLCKICQTLFLCVNVNFFCVARLVTITKAAKDTQKY